MTAPQFPTSAPRLPGYVVLDDGPLLERMLANIRDNQAILSAIKSHHTWDESGLLMTAFASLAGMEEAEAVEILHLRRMLGGGS